MVALIFKKLNEKILIDWEKLWKTSSFSNIVNSPAWFLAAYEAFQHDKYAIVAVYDHEFLVAIAAFVKTKRYGLPVYSIAGLEFADRQPLLADYNNDEVMRIFLSEIIKLGNIYFSAIRKDAAILINKYQKNSRFFISDINAYIDFTINSDSSLCSRKRTNLLNRLSRANQPVNVKFSIDNHNQELETIYNLDVNSSKSKKGRAVFDDVRIKKFYKLLARMMPSSMMTSLLYFGETPVAYNLGFIDHGSFIGSQKAHLSEFNYFNPGKIIEIKAMEYVQKLGINEYDLGRGYDRFKMDFSDNTRILYNIIVSKHSLVRSYYYFVYSLREKLYDLAVRQRKIYSVYRNFKKKLSLQRYHVSVYPSSPSIVIASKAKQSQGKLSEL
jgi:hypothetical protein